jgi:penicillin-binding protein 2
MEISYDVNGNVIKKEFIKEPISGNDVYLTIDIKLQIAAEDSLKKSVDSIKTSNAGAALAMTPKGEILAIASYPTYDLTQFESNEYYNSLLEDPANPLLDRALLGTYAPGSTYKVGSALAALERGLISSSTEYSCSGRYPHYHNPTCLGVHGSLNVIEAIGVSCNCFFYTVGDKLGIDPVTEYTNKLGLGAATGIELPERTGIVAGTDYRNSIGSVWNHSENLSAAIGQSDHSYTPLQIGVYISSILNGGERYSAHLLHSVKKFYTNEIVYEYSPTQVDKVEISASTLSTLKSGMRRVISSSSSLSSYFSTLDVGGKTGTAEVTGKNDYAVFMGFAPFDSPEIVGVCILEEGLNGGNAALPVRDVFKAYFSDKSVG